jgi:aspartate aminotransferase
MISIATLLYDFLSLQMCILIQTVLAYRTDEGKPWVLPVVRKTEKQLAEDETLNHEYLPVLGLDACSSAATKMLLGVDSSALQQGRVKLV